MSNETARQIMPLETQQVAIRSEGTMLMEVIQTMCSNPDFDPAKMQQIIDMRKEMFMEQARIEFNAAMARVQGIIQPIIADADNTQTGNRYAKLVTIVKTLAPIYTQDGFSISFGVEECSNAKLAEAGWSSYTADLEHIGGYTKHYHVPLPMDTVGSQGKVNKTQIHGTKSAISYARVILMGLMFNFTTSLDVDDDGNGAGKGKEPNPEDEPATKEQIAYIAEYRDAGQIPEATEEFLKARPNLTVKGAATVLNKLKKINAAKKT